MKLFYDLSKLKESTTFKHDAPLIGIIRNGIAVFLLLSSITVFSGIKIHVSEYLEQTNLIIKYAVLLLSYLIGCFGPDLVNTIVFAYVVSAILRKDFDRISVTLIVFCLLISASLTYYSFRMSQNSAYVLGNSIQIGNEKSDSSELYKMDLALSEKLSKIEESYTSEFNRLNTLYDNQVSDISKSYDLQIEVLRKEIELMNNSSDESNFLYTAKQKKPITEKIEELEKEKISALSPILNNKRDAINSLVNQKNRTISNAEDLSLSERQRVKNSTDNKNSKAEKTGNIFTNLFGSLAGYSVFALLLLAAIREILFFRNDISPEPMLSNFDFTPSWIWEVVSYPFVWLKTHTLNNVRTWYENLPDIKAPIVEVEILDGRSLDQSIKEPNHTEQYKKLDSANSISLTDNSGNIRSMAFAEKSVIYHTTKAIDFDTIGDEENAENERLKASQILKTFFEAKNIESTPKNIDSFLSKIEGYIQGKNVNPFLTLELPKSTDRSMSYDFIIGDKYTVEHRLLNGEIRRVKITEILSKIRQYSERLEKSMKLLEKAKSKGDSKAINKHSKSYQNNNKQLRYWNDKQIELIKKAKMERSEQIGS